MNERKYYMAIGIFVLSGFMALLFLAFRVSGGSAIYARDPFYTVQVEFTNVGRLKSQAKVALSGVTIGRVTAIQLDRESFQAIVSLELQQKYSQLPEDSVFSVVTAGLLGDNYVSVHPGFSSEFLQNGAYIDASQSTSALVLEEIVSKLFAVLASNSSDKQNTAAQPTP
jgi:phospholipid/cholesterol/gamma-HCH transport system substrate-binding protein